MKYWLYLLIAIGIFAFGCTQQTTTPTITPSIVSSNSPSLQMTDTDRVKLEAEKFLMNGETATVAKLDSALGIFYIAQINGKKSLVFDKGISPIFDEKQLLSILEDAYIKFGEIGSDADYILQFTNKISATSSPTPTKTVRSEALKYIKKGDNSSYFIVNYGNSTYYLIDVNDKISVVLDSEFDPVLDREMLIKILEVGNKQIKFSYRDVLNIIKFYNERKKLVV
ncbi:MAG: hypothetical protein AABY04_00800 [Candidatus Micrarchaeota archaeon]